MTIDERLEAITMTLELAIRDIEGQRVLIEEQRALTNEISEKTDRRINNLTQAIEMDGERINHLMRLIEMDTENIRTLASVAHSHETRLNRIEST